MRGKLLAWAALGLALLSTGCCMCANPYDYCGPTFRGGECDCCNENCRMNSVFDPCPVAHDEVYADAGEVETIESVPVPAEPAPANAPAPEEGVRPASVMQRVEQASYQRPLTLRR